MRETFLPFTVPCVGDEEIAEVADSMRSGWITTGPKTRRFEKEFAEYLGAPAALGLSSCTAALHTALVAADIGPGDEVITSTMTFTASAAVIEHCGARPVLVDIEPDTMNLDPALVRAAVTEKTRAVIAVHYGGHPCDLDAMRAICAEHELMLVEDAAHALPAKYRGEWIGACDNPVCYSFYATKNLCTAEGGMLTGTRKMIDKAVVYSLHGMDRDAWKRNDASGSWRYDVVTPGFKYNMADIMAAMGLVQLRRLEAMHVRRREIAARYTAGLSGIDAVDLPVEHPDIEHAWHLYPIRLRAGTVAISRDDFIEELRARKIGTSVHFIPVHTFTYYRKKYGYEAQDFPVAYRESERLISLPLYPGMSDGDVDDVIEAVGEIVTAHATAK